MKSKITAFIKNTLIWILCFISIFTSIYTLIPIAKSETNILNTQAALNSPILNDNATTDNWNKWEMVCWGVFLSNFCQPLIDNYESAFTTTSGRANSSNGSGLNALQFGTGRDPENNDIIRGFCEYAIQVEKETTPETIYVNFTKIEGGVFDDPIDPNNIPDDAEEYQKIREANANDMFFTSTKSGWSGHPVNEGDNISYVDLGLISDSIVLNISQDAFNNYANEFMEIESGMIPTFYVKRGNKYVIILDYTNSYDLQAMSVILNGIRENKANANYSDYFNEGLARYTSDSDDGSPIGLDCFGNIVIKSDRVMVFPACCNQHITETPRINTVTSWFLNPAISTLDSDTLVLEVQCADIETWLDKLAIGSIVGNGSGYTATGSNGLPPFGGLGKASSVGGFYYDLDEIAYSYALRGEEISYGEIVEELFNCNILTNNKQNYPLKYSTSVTLNKGIYTGNDKLTLMTVAATALANSNCSNSNEKQPEILSHITAPNGENIPIFSTEPICIANQFQRSSNYSDNKEKFKLKRNRQLYNFLFQAYNGTIRNSTAGSVTRAQVQSVLQVTDTPKELYSAIANSNGLSTTFKSIYGEELPTGWGSSPFWDFDGDDTASCSTARLIVFYPTSNMARTISNILSISDGSEFAVYSPYIYMTYLDCYGVINRSTLTTGVQYESEFNTELFDGSNNILNVDPATLSNDYKSQEEKENEVLDMGYLMLHPEEGREYRKKMIYNGVTDFIYEQYNRMVYGGTDSVYGGTASKANSGFLSIPTYNENLFTSFLIKGYEKIVVLLMGLILLLVVIFGILKSRRLSWYVISIVMVVNILLILPSMGEITPYVVTNMTNRVFSKHMTFWEISEGVANSSLEDQAIANTGMLEGFSDTETQTILRMVNQISAVYTDRSLMFKQDMSQKVTQQLGGIYTNIQSIQSARWILPVVMQQFSADAKADSEKYIYVRLSNVWDDASNIYWYYNPEEAMSATKPTLTSRQFVSSSSSLLLSADGGSVSSNNAGSETVATTVNDIEDGVTGFYRWLNLQNFYTDYIGSRYLVHSNGTNIDYKCFSYTLDQTFNDHSNDIHTYFWVLHRPGIRTIAAPTTNPLMGVPYTTADEYWGRYIDSAMLTLGGSASNWETDKDGNWESICQDYDRANAATMRDGFGYYRTTESPFYYFFCVVKDSFKKNRTNGGVIGQLQGKIEVDAGGNDVRSNFMYAVDAGGSMIYYDDYGLTSSGTITYTPYIRDVLDLEYFFKNTVPYMYEMTLISGGWDGESGILGDKKITEASNYYANSNQSWVYRCNWATKLMENPSFTSSQTIYLKDGQRKVVANPMLPSCYNDAGRQMVFSEAQMVDEGLTEEDLSLVELKCVAVNKAVAKNWTLLINYAGTSGMTKEILYRVMATSATEEFCKEFSTTGLTDNAYAIYPQSTDLRHLSFDAIMKMLLINSTRNTSYAYGSSVANVIESSSLASAILLLLDALFGSVLINFLQSVILAEILVLATYSMTRSLLSGAAYKAKIAGATFIQNILFMIYTIAYYGFIALFMSATSADEVLSSTTVKSSGGGPFFILLLFLVISVAYTYALGSHIVWLFKNSEDMGAERIGFALSTARQFISDKLDEAGAGIQNFFNTESSSENNITNNTNSISGTGFSADGTQDVNIKEVDGGSVNLTSLNDETAIESSLADDNAAYYYEETTINGTMSDTTSTDIDAEIQAGSEMSDEN